VVERQQPLYELNHVRYTYSAANTPPYTALKEITLKIFAGEFIAITGASGSGKSTLMHLLGLMALPSSGDLSLRGTPLRGMSENDCALLRNKTIGFLFQQFYLLPQLSVMRNILLPSEYATDTALSQHWQKRAQHLIHRFGLTGHEDKRPHQLSGGQKQRVALCRALMMEPEVLLCDEPTGALDSATAEEVLSTLEQLHREGRTIVVITHDPEVARRAERLVHVADGRIVSDQQNKTTQRLPSDSSDHFAPTPSLLPLKAPSQWLDAQALFEKMRNTMSRMFLPTLESLATQRLRTALTLTGLLIGVASVFIMMTLTRKVGDVFKDFFETQGARKAFVSFDWRQADRTGAPQWRGLHITQEIPLLNQQLNRWGRVDPTLESDGCQIISKESNFNGSLTGLNSLQEIRENALRVASGRLPLPNEFRSSPPSRIAVLGSDAAKKLFSPRHSLQKIQNFDHVIGTQIVVRGCKFEGVLTIVGVLQPQDSLMDRSINSAVYLPVPALLAGGASPYQRRLVTVPHEGISPTWFAQVVVNTLRIRTDNRFPFRYFAAEQELEKFNLMLNILTGLTLVIGGLCTLIGGIGVMNIMLVSVHERLREIGIRKSVGARPKDIRLQFLLESTGFCLLSGFLGTALGFLVSILALTLAKSLLPHSESMSFQLDPLALVLALSVSLGSGVVFGTWPARQAGQLEIVDALKEE
jgi:macrolide transport system ATP-binding/permease protein